MLRLIRKSGTGVHQKTLNRLVRFIDQFKSMNSANDTDMEQMPDQTRRELLSETTEEYRDNRSASQKLVDGLTAFGNQARELAKQEATELVQRFGELGPRKFNQAA